MAAALLFVAAALALLRDGWPADRVLVAGGNLAASLPWSAVLPSDRPVNAAVVDQSRIYWPYLREAAAVYAGEADPLWTSRGGGGLPFLGNATSSLLHPLTLLAAVAPLERVPLLQGVAVLALSSWLTFLFLRRLGLSFAASLFGGTAFGFGGHQVLWLQYALSHTLVGLPACFLATEWVVADRSRRRLAVLAACFGLLVLGGHPETAFVAALVAGLWALWRLWDSHGRWLVAGAVLLAAGLTAVQWWPFLEYALVSHGKRLRELEDMAGAHAVSLGAGLVWTAFFLFAVAVLRACVTRGLAKRIVAVSAVVLAVVIARRMGMALSASTLLMPNLYGSPAGGGAFSGAQDYPGLNAAYVGSLPVLLLAAGALAGLGGGFVRFFAWTGLLLWGAAFHMPGAENLVRLLPGVGEVGGTRLLGPVAFVAACGGAKVLDLLCRPDGGPDRRRGVARVLTTLGLGVAAAAGVLSLPVDPHGGRTVRSQLLEPGPFVVHRGDRPIAIRYELDGPVDDLRVSIDNRLLRSGPAAPAADGEPLATTFVAQRAEEGFHRLRVEAWRQGVRRVIADQPLIIHRAHRLDPRDLAAALASLVALLLLLSGRVRWAPAAACVVVAFDVLSLGRGWNTATPRDELFPPTRTVAWLAAQAPPFRIFTEGTILPPDTQHAVGLDHLLSYDNLGYHRTYLWLLSVMDMDHFGTFSFSRESVRYDNPRFDALDVRYVLTRPDVDLSDLGLLLAHESETRVWENPRNLGRAWVVGRTEIVGSGNAERLWDVDPAEVALLEEPLAEPLGGRGTARVIEHAGSRVRVEVECDGPALLVLAENRAEGWTAAVDGGPARPTLACDVAWQAVTVPAGLHQVEFRYAPASVEWGLRLSVATAALMVLMLLLPRRLR